jgi:hypothetical protein
MKYFLNSFVDLKNNVSIERCLYNNFKDDNNVFNICNNDNVFSQFYIQYYNF